MGISLGSANQEPGNKHENVCVCVWTRMLYTMREHFGVFRQLSMTIVEILFTFACKPNNLCVVFVFQLIANY